ncbi:MAG: radical SAM protein [Candidatus Pacebacteria bacterium]|nr:radical SAM protein [Candidatus Paceibacterota bacterium]
MIKKIILIYPPFPMSERYGRGLSSIGTCLPPLGLLSLGAVLEKENYKVEVYDSDLLNSDIGQLVEYVENFSPDFVGIYCNTSNYRRVIDYASAIKKISSAPICLGGPHPVIMPEEVLKNSCVDIVVMGEGENTLIELLEALNKKSSLKNVKGLGYKDESGNVFVNEKRELIQDLDKLPMPARHLVPIEKYRPSPHHYKELPMTTMIVSRGCPFGCLFCASRNVWGKNYRNRSVEKVVEEIKFLIKKYGIKNINFWDDLWGLKDEWTRNFCNKIISEKIKISWSCERRVDTVNFETLKLMKKAGCYSIFYGVESLDQECLNNINKGITVKQAEEAMRLTREAGIEVRANFIIGLPGDTPEKTRKTIKKICEINPDYIKFNIMTPYPGTELYNQVKSGKWGRFEEDWSRSTGYFATFLPYGYKNFEEIEAIRKYAFRKFHFRPRYILRRASKIRSLNDIKKYWNGMMAVLKI